MTREQMITHLTLLGWMPFEHGGDYNLAHPDYRIIYIDRPLSKTPEVMVFSNRLRDYEGEPYRLQISWDKYTDRVLSLFVDFLEKVSAP